jgi:hypothetical protein
MVSFAYRVAIGVLLLSACRGAVALTAPLPAPSHRRALLIGIDDYDAAGRRDLRPSTAEERFLPRLRGAVRDVELVRQMLLLRYGFRPNDVVLLRNHEATRDAILQAIERHLIEPASAGDGVLFYYAGHGSQVENSLSDELDKRDESIVPADSRRGAPDIRDKELSARFNRLLDHGAKLTVVLDSCHSGSGARGLAGDAEVRAVAPDAHDVHDPQRPPPPESRGALVLSATKDFARAYEVSDEEGHYHGVFSWALLRAMGNAADGEAAADTFLRAQAMMRAESPYQDPVMSGNAAAQTTPLLQAGKAVGGGAPAIAVEQVRPDGMVLLQGGWANGLTVGTELRPRPPADPALRIRVTNILGLGRSEARGVVPPATPTPSSLPSGTLLEIATWSPPPGRPMRVSMPRVDDVAPALRLARELRSEASRQGVVWVDDPTETTPTHIVRWRAHGVELVAVGRTPVHVAVDAPAIVAAIPPESRLFVQLPAPAALLLEIDIGPGTEHDSITEAKSSEAADYVLVGRAVRAGVEYAWVRPDVHRDDTAQSPLPPRTDWIAPLVPADAGLVLQHAILRLHKILAWHLLPSPPSSPSPYRLTLLRPQDRVAVSDGRMTGRQTYPLVLRAAATPLPAKIRPRYFYVFGIDSFGRSVLLFPLGGSVENHFPIDVEKQPPAEIPIGTVTVDPPYGTDTYVLLSTDESLPNPSVLEWAGVRTRGPKGATPLEELLSRTGGASRSMTPCPTPPNWSIDRVVMTSVSPQ